MLWEIAMMLVFINFTHAVMNYNTIFMRKIRMMKFAKITSKGSNKTLRVENKSVTEIPGEQKILTQWGNSTW
jgi:hypothetical protein